MSIRLLHFPLPFIAIGVSWWTTWAAPVDAQTGHACGTDVGGTIAAAQGRRITAIDVWTAAPARLPGGVASALHVTTREHTVRSRLLFAVGDALDSLRVSESVRQLHALRFLAGADISALCDDLGGVALNVSTRDGWSMWPRFAFRGAARSSAGLEETNLFGTGRAVQLHVRSDDGQLGIGARVADPTLFGDRAIGTVSHDAYRHGSGWRGSLHTPDHGVFSPWTVAMVVQQSLRQAVARTALSARGDSVRRGIANVTVSRRVRFSPLSATYFLVGAEAERTALVAGPELPLIGPSRVRRAIVAVDIGLARRSGHFVDAPWLLPTTSENARRLMTRAEVPLGFEFDGVLGIGRDVNARRAATHVDAWAGRHWPLGLHSAAVGGARVPVALLSADAWASGYRTRGSGDWSAGTVRASFGLVAPARRGLWSARISGEQLSDPDPDVRGLALVDPTLRAVPVRSRLAELVVTASAERTLHLWPLSRSYFLDAALFGAGSMRWDVAAVQQNTAAPYVTVAQLREPTLTGTSKRLSLASVGAGLRVTPTRFGRATVRLDVAFPVLHSPGRSGRPYFGISVSPAFGNGRNRERRALSGIP